MKKHICFLTLFLFSHFLISAQALQEGVYEDLTISSKKLNKAVNYSIYLPPGYGKDQRRYPVVYLLHGFSDDDSGWIQFGNIQYYADKAIAAGEIAPMIIVMPDAGVSWYVNSHDGKVPYEDFFFEELIPLVDKLYRTRPEKSYRGVAGLSMGGHATLIYLMRHPDVFAAGAALSAAVFTDEEFAEMPQQRFDSFFGTPYGASLSGEKRLHNTWKTYSVFHILENKPVEELKKVRYYIDCGDDDFLIRANNDLHNLMLDKGIPHEYRVRDGGHQWEYWRTGITESLKFISKSFHR